MLLCRSLDVVQAPTGLWVLKPASERSCRPDESAPSFGPVDKGNVSEGVESSCNDLFPGASRSAKSLVDSVLDRPGAKLHPSRVQGFVVDVDQSLAHARQYIRLAPLYIPSAKARQAPETTHGARAPPVAPTTGFRGHRYGALMAPPASFARVRRRSPGR